MEAHTPKREAVEKFLASHKEQAAGWHIRAIDHQEEPVIVLEAVGQNAPPTEQPRKLEIHTRQVNLAHDEIDDTTKKMIERWLDSLPLGEHSDYAN